MPWRDKAGNVIGIMGVSRDITELKQAQKEAAQWQARFKFVLDTLPLGISWAQIAEDGGTTLQLINDEHLRICGLTREEAKQWSNFRRVTHPDDAERQDAYRFQIAQGKIDRFSMEKRYLRPDGQTVWVSFSYLMRKCGDGTVEDLSYVIDITERKMVEEKLRRLEVPLNTDGQP
jgi:PAS domain S-box-containing protein